MKMLHALFLVFLAMAATAADNPYNETADAKLEIKQALTQAVTAKTPVIVVFGANWCGDCQMLNTAMKSGASAQLLSRDFQIVKVNVGQFDKNLDVAKSYGVPGGIACRRPKNGRQRNLRVLQTGDSLDDGKEVKTPFNQRSSHWNQRRRIVNPRYGFGNHRFPFRNGISSDFAADINMLMRSLKSMADWHKRIIDVTHHGGFRPFQ